MIGVRISLGGEDSNDGASADKREVGYGCGGLKYGVELGGGGGNDLGAVIGCCA